MITKNEPNEIFRELASVLLFLSSGAFALAGEFNWAILVSTWAIYLEVYDGD